MSGIIRKEINEDWAHTGIVKAGDYCFLSYCVGNIGGTIEERSTEHSIKWKNALRFLI